MTGTLLPAWGILREPKSASDSVRGRAWVSAFFVLELCFASICTAIYCLEAIGQLPQAQLAYTHAHRLAPDSVQYLGFLAQAVQSELSQTKKALKIRQGK